MMNYRKLASGQDRRIAKDSNWGIVTNSGAVPGKKGDLKQERILAETKTVEKPQKSFTLKEAWMDKLAEQAFRMGKEFHVLFFSFGGLEDFAVLPQRDFDLIFDSMVELEEVCSSLSDKVSGLEDSIRRLQEGE